jgi:hypothetical protein
VLEKFHDKTNVGRGLAHIVYEHHLPDHERGQNQSDSKAAEHNEWEPRDVSCSLQLNDACLEGVSEDLFLQL